MSCQALAPGAVRTYVAEDMLEPELFELAGGSVAVLSAKHPERAGANEDAAAVIALSDGSAVLVVADGCGGMASGGEASRLAVESLARHVADADGNESGLVRSAILDAVEQANQEILDLKTGAGSTLAVVHVDHGEAKPYHVGDSQILLVGNRGRIKMLTTSHSPVGYAVESGMLAEDDALEHEERHLLSNYLGFDGMHVDVGSVRKLSRLDGLLIASDGVLDNLLVDELVELLRSGSAMHVAQLVGALAWERMQSPVDGAPHKPDDMTLIVYTQRRGGRRRRRPCR